MNIKRRHSGTLEGQHFLFNGLVIREGNRFSLGSNHPLYKICNNRFPFEQGSRNPSVKFYAKTFKPKATVRRSVRIEMKLSQYRDTCEDRNKTFIRGRVRRFTGGQKGSLE